MSHHPTPLSKGVHSGCRPMGRKRAWCRAPAAARGPGAGHGFLDHLASSDAPQPAARNSSEAARQDRRTGLLGGPWRGGAARASRSAGPQPRKRGPAGAWKSRLMSTSAANCRARTARGLPRNKGSEDQKQPREGGWVSKAAANGLLNSDDGGSVSHRPQIGEENGFTTFY